MNLGIGRYRKTEKREEKYTYNEEYLGPANDQ